MPPRSNPHLRFHRFILGGETETALMQKSGVLVQSLKDHTTPRKASERSEFPNAENKSLYLKHRLPSASVMRPFKEQVAWEKMVYRHSELDGTYACAPTNPFSELKPDLRIF